MKYDLDQYQNDAMVFRLDTADHFYALMNLSGEVGELHSLLAKAVRDGEKEGHMANIKKELGDILWCLAAIASDYNMSLSSIADGNIRKLDKRLRENAITGSGDNR